MGVQPHTRAQRRPKPADRAGRWAKVVARILAVDAKLDRVAAQLGEPGGRQRLAGGDAQLLDCEIDTGQKL